MNGTRLNVSPEVMGFDYFENSDLFCPQPVYDFCLVASAWRNILVTICRRIIYVVRFSGLMQVGTFDDFFKCGFIELDIERISDRTIVYAT